MHDHVSFGLEMEPVPDVHYALRAVVVHHGELHGGHYTASVVSDDANWYHYDDAAPPTVCAPADVLRQQAYMLFYSKEEAHQHNC